MFLRTSTPNTFTAFSPDGRWVAYTDAEAGRNEVYVQAYPKKGIKVPISNSGGTTPVWGTNELFYRSDDQRIMVASYKVQGDSFIAEKPRV